MGPRFKNLVGAQYTPLQNIACLHFPGGHESNHFKLTIFISDDYMFISSTHTLPQNDASLVESNEAVDRIALPALRMSETLSS